MSVFWVSSSMSILAISMRPKLPSWKGPWPSSVKNLFDGGSVFFLEITAGYKKEVAFGKIILFVLTLPVEIISLNLSVVRDERGGLISVGAIQINHLERGFPRASIR